MFAIIAVIFAYLYFTAPNPTVSNVYENVSADVTKCSDDLAAWKETYGDQASSSAKQNALNDVLAGCEDALSESRETLN